ncbi:ATP-dependent Lhr-like helicase [Melghirimyces profundicolus]|uniref:ATP-dependent Lhr-like helicase n=1 Tax=Melghirimyces profundicolus TaxID=1242148 RepID=A0A2T6B9G9_9BACL|nr:DEAD/DEAH box helicase [Melghirimyces profundicolus]PTX52703.1 ATP-dependent Lhr-like helicase [Melghirimyces profundicolus]
MSRSCFSLLSPEIQKAIWDMGWKTFTPIQQLAIPAIVETEDPVILAAGTASGKTEAAFLPILSRVNPEAKETLQVLYISPLKALINDQFERIERLCEYVGIEVHKWHGDVTESKKRKFRKAPKGILQITPESLESLFINRSSLLHSLWNSCSFIVIDEVHAFMGAERGVQLRSLLGRIAHYSHKPPRIIALSATLNDDGTLRRWIDADRPDRVQLLETGSEDKEIRYFLFQADSGTDKVPLEIYKDLRDLSRNHSTMIFCNNRSLVESSSVILNRMAEKENDPGAYLVHHSSIDKTDREFTEQLLKQRDTPRSVICTSTLELGIDIGHMDLVVQLDTTFSVSSLKQRIGRTGRREGMPQILQMYTTHKYSLLQAIAVTELFLEEWVEPPNPYAIPYDVLFHQLLSICAERNGLTRSELVNVIQRLAVFDQVRPDHFQQLIDHMLEKEYLEEIQGSGELIVGLEGERLLRRWDFYAVFMVNREYDVFHRHKRVGSVGVTPQVTEGANLILGGKLWTIESVDEEKLKVYVIPAVNGKAPNYFGGSILTHRRVAEKMAEVLCSDTVYPYLNEAAVHTLSEMRRTYHSHRLTPDHRLIERTKNEAMIYLFAGTKIANTFTWMLRSLGYSVRVSALDSIKVAGLEDHFSDVVWKVLHTRWVETELIRMIHPERMRTKYSIYLPEHLQDLLHISGQMVIDETLEFLRNIQFVESVVTD